MVGGRGGVGGGTRRGGCGDERRGGAGGGTGRGVGATVAVVRCGTGGGCGWTGWICCGGGWSFIIGRGGAILDGGQYGSASEGQ